jgi:hypothetical protein
VRYSFAEYTPWRFSPGYLEKERKTRARADDHRVVAFGEEFVHRSSRTDDAVQYNLDAELGQRIDLILHDRLRQAELGMPYTSTPPALWKASKTVTR